MVTVSEEKAVDYGLTAKLATAAFADDHVQFSAARIKWLYEQGFGQGTTVLSAFDSRQKIGQIALIGHRLCIDGEAHAAVQLVDLFIVQTHRSARLVRRLYRKVEEICLARNVRYILALPNDKSAVLNARFLKLAPLMSLPVRAGVALRAPSGKLGYSGLLKSLGRPQASDLLSRFASASSENGVAWDGESLSSRLDDPTRDYAVHAGSDALLISTCRKRQSLNYTVLCAFLTRPRCRIARRDLNDLVPAACAFWKAPLFVYAGLNSGLPALPGVPLPARLRRPILVQLRDLTRDDAGVRLDRFQLIESDFA